MEVDTSTYHYKSRRREQAGLEARIKEIAQVRVRYGYRRVHVLLRREGWTDNVKRVYRIYRGLGLQLRKKPPRWWVRAKLREDRQAAVRPNDVWAMDFVHDQLATGQKLRVLTVVDTFSRYCPGLDVRFRYRGGTLWRRWSGFARRLVIRGRSGLIRGRSLSAAIWICGPTRGAWNWTSRGQAN
jgi:putative transposase